MTLTQTTYTRDVVASLVNGNIVVSIDPPERIKDVGQGDIVEWHCQNQTGNTLTLAVGNFRAGAAYAHLVEERNLDPDPFEPGPPRYVQLPGQGGAGVIRCEVLHNAYTTRTYKYDILDGGGNMLLDPEIEIER